MISLRLALDWDRRNHYLTLSQLLKRPGREVSGDKGGLLSFKTLVETLSHVSEVLYGDLFLGNINLINGLFLLNKQLSRHRPLLRRLVGFLTYDTDRILGVFPQ